MNKLYIEKRRKEAYRLREYHNALKQAKAFTNETWIDNLIAANSPYMPLESWIAYLEHCIVEESERLIKSLAA